MARLSYLQIFLSTLILHLSFKVSASTAVDDERCPPASKLLPLTGKCVTVAMANGGWRNGFESMYAARRKCLELGGEIASVAGEVAEAEALAYIATVLTPDTNAKRVYIGLNDLELEGNFQWFDNSPTRNYFRWGSGEPNSIHGGNEDCVVIRTLNGRWEMNRADTEWHDYPCCHPAGIKAVLCQFKLEDVTSEEGYSDSTSIGEDSMQSPFLRLEDDLLAVQCLSPINECSSNPCRHGSTCLDLIGGYRCTCPEKYDGIHCELEACYLIENVQNADREGNGSRHGSDITFRCHDGFQFGDKTTATRFVCADGEWNPVFRESCLPIDECESSPCENNATCIDDFLEYKCTCASGFDGKHCELSDCLKQDDIPNADRHGNDSRHDSRVNFTCHDGFQFDDKTTNRVVTCNDGEWKPASPDLCLPIDECESNPCRNNASCIDGFRGYKCTCTAGFEGIHCEKAECEPPVRLENANRQGNETTNGSVITYTCLPGFQFDGRLKAETQLCFNGQWQPNNPPPCRAIPPLHKTRIPPKEAPGAAAVGTVAIIFLTCEVALVVLMDLDHLARHFRMFTGNISAGLARLCH